MDAEILVFIDYLVNDTKNNPDLLVYRIKHLLSLIPNESKIAVLGMYKEKKTLEIKQKIKDLCEQLEALNES